MNEKQAPEPEISNIASAVTLIVAELRRLAKSTADHEIFYLGLADLLEGNVAREHQASPIKDDLL